MGPELAYAGGAIVGAVVVCWFFRGKLLTRIAVGAAIGVILVAAL